MSGTGLITMKSRVLEILLEVNINSQDKCLFAQGKTHFDYFLIEMPKATFLDLGRKLYFF